MQQYLIRRILLNFFVLFLVATMVFAALRIDTSSVVTRRAGGCLAGGTGSALQEQCEVIARAELGLVDQVLPISLDGSLPFIEITKDNQYTRFLGDLSPVTY